MKKAIIVIGFCFLSLVICGCGKPKPNNVIFEKTEYEVTIPDELDLNYELVPSNADKEKLSWKSMDESIAKVSSGRITPVKAGTTKIIVICERDTLNEITIKVRPEPAFRQLSDDEQTIYFALRSHIKDYPNPSSIRINYIEESEKKEAWYLTLSGGAGTTYFCTITKSGSFSRDIYRYGYGHYYSCRTYLIEQALSEYLD